MTWTVVDIARDLKRDVSTVKSWIYTGKLKASKVNGAYQIESQEYKRFLKEESPNYRLY